MCWFGRTFPVPVVLTCAVAGALAPPAAADPAPRVVLKGHTDEVYALAFSPDGKALASAGQDASIRMWDLAAGKERAVLTRRGENEGLRHTVYCVAFSPDGKTLASGGNEDVIRLWDLATGKERAALKGRA